MIFLLGGQEDWCLDSDSPGFHRLTFCLGGGNFGGNQQDQFICNCYSKILVSGVNTFSSICIICREWPGPIKCSYTVHLELVQTDVLCSPNVSFNCLLVWPM